MTNLVKIGVAQFSSVHLDLDKSMLKLGEIVSLATNQDVQLLVFGESWLSGYPAWLDYCPDVARWNHQPMKEVFLKFYRSSVTVPGKEIAHIGSLAKKNGMVICIGINERIDEGPGQGTIYNSVVTIGSDGKILNHHRKLMPTFNEKLLYGLGDGRGLKAVSTSIGQVSTSICWEHWMPLTRQVLHNSGEDIHIAHWPAVGEMHQVASRHYAFEGRCFVIAAAQMMKVRDFPSQLETPKDLADKSDQWILNGGSCVIRPNGQFLVEPVFGVEELIVTEMNLDEVIQERMTLDTSGHYQRPDLFTMNVHLS